MQGGHITKGLGVILRACSFILSLRGDFGGLWAEEGHALMYTGAFSIRLLCAF